MVSEREVVDTDAQYTLIPKLEKSKINPGEEIRLGVYIVGSGSVEENKLHVNYHNEEVIDVDDPGVICRNLVYDKEKKIVGKPEEPNERNADPRGSTEYLRPQLLEQGNKKEEFALQWKSIEGVRDGDPVYVFNLNTRDDATPGDYTIDLVFTYLVGGVLKQSRADTEVHVKNWREQKEPYVTYGALVAVIIAVLSFIVQLFTVILPVG